jgi:uncharacterized protein
MDKRYLTIVSDILNNENFIKIENIKHHNSNRLEHSLKVSYFAYKIAKNFGLDYISVARAGLLHDFYLERTKDYRNFYKKIKLFANSHPKDAVYNSSFYFDLNDKEIDIILTHMFPLNLQVPKYLESWIINMVDSTVSIYEFSHKFKYELSYVANLYAFFIINMIK